MTASAMQIFTEDEIRPSVLKTRMRRALEEDLKWLCHQKSEFIPVSCPACGSNDYSFAFEKYSFVFVECNSCETVFMNPRATPEILKEFYSRSALYDIWNRFVFPSSADIRREKIFRARVNKILDICVRYDVKTNCLLEVGAGFGIFCEEIIAADRFHHIIAVEPGNALAETCRSKGINTIEDSIENIQDLEQTPDVVVSFEVIEHLFSPIHFLQNCNRLMNPNSIIAVTCPNYKGFDISALGNVSESIDAEHINLFNPKSLPILFNRAGFSILECTTPGELDADIVRNKIIDELYDVSGQPLLKTILIDRWDELGAKFQFFLRENKLSSHMWIVARKPA